MHVVVHLQLHFGYYNVRTNIRTVNNLCLFFRLDSYSPNCIHFVCTIFSWGNATETKDDSPFTLQRTQLTASSRKKKLRKRKTHRIHVEMCQSFPVAQCAMPCHIFFLCRFAFFLNNLLKFAHLLEVVNERSQKKYDSIWLPRNRIINNKFPTAMHFDRV